MTGNHWSPTAICNLVDGKRLIPVNTAEYICLDEHLQGNKPLVHIQVKLNHGIRIL